MTHVPLYETPLATWAGIDCVLLDLDGTLLDLHFDNHFWLEHVPRRYAESQRITVEESKRRLYDRYHALRGTLSWYSIDHWAGELELDIVRLKREVDHLIAVRPNAVRFLDAVRASNRRVVLATNAHPESLLLKMEKTRLGGHFDAVYTAHEFACPKEERGYWQALFDRERQQPARCLLIDDNPGVLETAGRFGIGQLLGVSQPDSRAPHMEHSEFPLLRDFTELLPIEGR